MSSPKHIEWEKDEHGQQVGKWSVSTEAALNRWQKVYDSINELEERLRKLENKSK